MPLINKKKPRFIPKIEINYALHYFSPPPTKNKHKTKEKTHTCI